jgi:hypothetical protein
MKATLIPALLTAILAGLYPAASRAESVIVQWEKVYNGPGNSQDLPTAVAVDSAGNVIVNGGSYGNLSSAYYTAKYAAANGALLWEKRHNNSSGVHSTLAVDSADNVIVNGNDDGYHTVKYAAANGTLLWEKRYNNGPNDNPQTTSLALDNAGNVIVTGYSDSNITPFRSDIYTAKYAAANGALLWEKRYNGPENSGDGAYGVAVDSAGNAIVTGYSGLRLVYTDYYTAKYAAVDGALLWEMRYHGPGSFHSARDVVVDSQNNAIVTGTSRSIDGNDDQYTAKYATADGALLWEKRLVGTGGGLDYASLALDDAGNVIVTGPSVRSGGNSDIYTAKYAAADGALLWEKRYNGTGNFDDFGNAVAVDSEGGIIVTGGTNWNATGSGDFYTVKYVSTDGDDDGLLDSWEMAHFGGREGQSALDDTDGDGAVELLELAFGTDPRSPNSVPAPAVVSEGGYLTTTITKQPCVRYLVETGATLEGGFSATSTTVLADTATTLKVRDNVPVGTQPERFLRVQVTAAP